MQIIEILLPMFLMLGTGTFYRWLGGRINPDSLTNLIMNLFMPCLIFSALLNTKVTVSQLGNLALANLLLVGSLFFIAWLVSLTFDTTPGSYYLPVLFMNAGFIGIPLLNFYGGDPAMTSVIIFDQVQTLLIFTVGLALVTTKFPLRRQILMFAREPVVGAILAGLLIPTLPWNPSGPVASVINAGLEGITMLGEATIPIALFLVGYVLHQLQPKIDWAVISACGLRLIVSPILALGIWFGFNQFSQFGLSLTGPDAAAVFIASALPSAVFSYVLAQRYEQDPGYAAGVVFYSSVAMLVSLPVVLYLSYNWFPPNI